MISGRIKMSPLLTFGLLIIAAIILPSQSQILNSFAIDGQLPSLKYYAAADKQLTPTDQLIVDSLPLEARLGSADDSGPIYRISKGSNEDPLAELLFLNDNQAESSGPTLLVDDQQPQLETKDLDNFERFLQKQLESYSSLAGGADQMAVQTRAADLNTHLPASDSIGDDDTILGPVNDPEEFEASLGYLTGALNRELPNSSNRSAILAGLMSGESQFGAYLRELQQRLSLADDNDIDLSIGDESNEQTVGSLAPKISPKLSENLKEADGATKSPSSQPTANSYSGGEYIDHPLAIIGHQYMQGGAGEGRQLLGPDGSFENVQVIKSDQAVPSYCDPPNPCPIGYTAEDGCLEKYVNSASFSREYQAKQQCSCDNEHSLFNCAAPVGAGSSKTMQATLAKGPAGSREAEGGDGESGNQIGDEQTEKDSQGKQVEQSKLSTLARTIQNRFGNLASLKSLIASHEEQMNTN